MSELRLVTDESQPGRKETGSTVSTTAVDDDLNASGIIQYSGKSPPDLVARRKASTPSSPSSEKVSMARMQQPSKPPGLTGGNNGVPSPVVKGHTKNNSSATSPLLTLTPNSSIDGNEWNHNRQSPATTGAPSLPFLGPKGLAEGAGTDVSSFGSFDMHEHDANDGLLGLDALQNRNEAGGTRPYSASPPAGRMGLAGAMDERGRRGERPPLSHSAQAYEGSTGSYAGDRSVGERSAGSGGYTSYVNNVSMESADSTRGFGAIARPELRYPTTEYDPNRRRSFSTENFHSGNYGNAGYESGQGHFPQKFGSLPSLGSHIHQHRMHGPQEGYSDLQRPRHIRSVSQPMQNPFPQQMDPRAYGQPSYEPGIPKQHASFGRSASLTQTGLAHSYDGGQYTQKRSSLPGYPPSSAGYGQLPHSLQRRDALDYQGTTPHDDMRMFGGPNMISPGQSPLQTHYATSSHSRHPSDAGSTMLSSSPISLGSAVMRNRLGSGAEDELAHPLIGENIDVPLDHFGDSGHGGGYMLGHSTSMPMMRPSGHGHSMSMDQIPQYLEAPSHLPTAGAGLPLPKVVYYVKFKRTQRNFVLGPRINRDLKIGTYVKVEADRGEDLGIVVGKVPADKYNFANRNQYTAGMGPPPGTGAADLKRIIRLATHDEVALLGMKREEEEELLGICRTKVRARGLPMNVVDAEYQFDRHKLTFFFEAEGRVDFRELVRDLFSMYKTRIWMQQLDKNTSTSSPAIMAPQAANIQMDYGTPIIAPASEFADSVVLNGMGDARSH